MPRPMSTRSAQDSRGPVGGAAAALVDLMQFDHVAARVVDKDLLGLRAVDPGHRPIRDAEPIEFGPGFLDVGDRERDMRDRRVLVRTLGQR